MTMSNKAEVNCISVHNKFYSGIWLCVLMNAHTYLMRKKIYRKQERAINVIHIQAQVQLTIGSINIKVSS